MPGGCCPRLTHPGLKSLHIEGYDGRDGAGFAALASLEALGLARGLLASLGPLRHRAAMRSLTLAHLRSLTDVAELRHLPGLETLTLGESPPGVVDLAPVLGCTCLQSQGIVGTKAEDEDTAWLREVGRLRLLRLQFGVRSLAWDDLFSPSQLEKLAVVSAQLLDTTEAEIRDIAAAAGHRVREFVRFGTRRRPAWLLDLAH